MNLRAMLANALWAASNLPAWHLFRAALRDPQAAQESVLRDILARASDTAFGQAHQFSRIQSYANFTAHVPIRDYGEIEPWIDRILGGETNVLTAEPVKRLATTGGTSGARKLIPYTAGLQTEFNRAIGPWIIDLFRQQPSLMLGSAYWSISPVARAGAEASKVPIGFEEDSEYLGGIRRHLIDAVMAVPAKVRHAPTIEAWRQQTIGYLSRANDLRLISVWHPSFLSLLLDHLPGDPSFVWPRLGLVSCWGDGHAEGAMSELQQRLPGVRVQTKGLIATEGIVSIPFAGGWPLAIRSHFLEFVEPGGGVRRAHELRENETYEVLLTTSGGLYRYRLNDRVQVNGRIEATPSIRFVGKTETISDRFGEKLSDAFVTGVLKTLMNELGLAWHFAMLAPDGNRYTLYVQGDTPTLLAARLDRALRENPQYAYCRDFNQLGEAAIFRIVHDAAAIYLRRLTLLGRRTGDIKPTALSPLDDWGSHFQAGMIRA